METALVTFCFDDGRASAVREGALILERLGVCGTFYPIPALVGTQNEHGAYASWDDLRQAEQAGHEMGNHTRRHVREWMTWSSEEQRGEISSADGTMINVGALYGPRTFAYPFGLHTIALRTLVATTGYPGQYIAARTIDPGINTPATNPYQLKSLMVKSHHELHDVRAALTEAARLRGWLILTFHHIDTNGTFISTPPSLFESMVSMVAESSVPIFTLKEGATHMFTRREKRS